MGEYWLPVNVTKREYIHPHELGCGLKHAEWNWDGSVVWNRINELFDRNEWSKGDDIRATSDYSSEKQLFGEEIELNLEGEDNLYYYAETFFKERSRK